MSETWIAPARSAEARALYTTAEADRAAHPERYRLDPDALLARALGDDAVDALGDGDWREGFARYLESAAQDGRLNALGIRMAGETAVGRLRARRAMARHLAAHPDVLARRVVAPIVITGGWRTGTTFLFRMLATDPRLRAPLPAELAAPWRFGELAGAEREAALDAAAPRHATLHRLNPELAVIHASGARLPEECVLAMGTDFCNWGFPSTTRLDGYARWLAGQSFEGAYRRYRAMLQALQVDARRFVLKAPAHCSELPSLLDEFPDACVVHLHRDAVATITSGANLFAVFRSTYSDAVDPHDVGRYQAEQTALWLDRALAFRDGEATRRHDARFVDLDYRSLVADPIAAARHIYDAIGMELPPDVVAGFEQYRSANRQHARGLHRYDTSMFGLDAGALRERFARYELRFGARERA
jgi:Sulfotransferase family